MSLTEIIEILKLAKVSAKDLKIRIKRDFKNKE